MDTDIIECPLCNFKFITMHSNDSCHRCGIKFDDPRLKTMHHYDLMNELNKEFGRI
jgi:DNA-directed RNA polymerase subunit RPC12/RpoP